MATIKRLCALQTCRRSLWVSPPCPPQEGAQPKGLWQEEGKQPTAPAEPLAALQSLCSLPSPLHPLWWASASLSPLHQPLVPSQDTSLCWSLQCKSWLQRTERALSYIHNPKSHNDFGNAKVSGCARPGGRWEREVLSLSWGKGQELSEEQLIRAGLAPPSPAAPNSARPLPSQGPWAWLQCKY